MVDKKLNNASKAGSASNRFMLHWTAAVMKYSRRVWIPLPNGGLDGQPLPHDVRKPKREFSKISIKQSRPEIVQVPAGVELRLENSACSQNLARWIT